MATANEFKFSTRCHTIDSCHTPACCCCCCYWQTACENARVRRSLRERGRQSQVPQPMHSIYTLKAASGRRRHTIVPGGTCVATLQRHIANCSCNCIRWLQELTSIVRVVFSFFCQQFAVIKDICVQHVHPCTIVSACPLVRCVRCRFALMKLHYTKWCDEERCEKQKKSAKLHKNTQEKRERE